MEVKIEFLDGDSTVMQCKYNSQHFYKEIEKLCRTCHRPMPYHHAGCEERQSAKGRTRRERSRTRTQTLTPVRHGAASIPAHRLVRQARRMPTQAHEKMVLWETIGCALPRANERVLTRLAPSGRHCVQGRRARTMLVRPH